MVHIVWPTVVHCVFAAFLYGGEGAIDPKIQIVPVKQPMLCQSIQASVNHRAVVLVKDLQRVEIPIPLDEEWRPLKYWWGVDKAFIGNHFVNVKMGPKALY